MENHLGKETFWIDENKERYFVTVSYGEGKTIQFPNSDVSLYVPQGSEEYFMRVLTHDPIYTDFDRIPEDECVIAPVVEVRHVPFENSTNHMPDAAHCLKIPHCLLKQDMRNRIKVR